MKGWIGELIAARPPALIRFQALTAVSAGNTLRGRGGARAK